MTIQIGDKVPSHSFSTQEGETRSFEDFKGKTVVLYFYPKDMTPGCTTQACDFRDHHAEFNDLNAVILGVSPDPLKKHESFINKYDLPFELISDENNELAEAFGVWQLKKNFGKEYMGIVRSTFIINPDGELVKEWRSVKVKGHVESALEYVKENA
ncbi:thioredoxin-dependent thiol peroxidase [Paenalkalicoccus suaedae]|uniref:thioredoxin-dependent peroxiredoxin n=1 Tax=Paenalkalicoccus suaedae TaxID=2592382 RepID=A0A859FBI3_9BACI|nr:thioredoxin-dependent thiol peroxidase [Paenalkalicoccus suaedae]QKS70629.1 thioredoxin-dependent thiol peroxidase [Paenalkalicoccus suaedae]